MSTKNSFESYISKHIKNIEKKQKGGSPTSARARMIQNDIIRTIDAVLAQTAKKKKPHKK